MKNVSFSVSVPTINEKKNLRYPCLP